MRVEGTREFAAPREAVFAALTDPQLVAEAIPLVGNLQVQDRDRWSAEVKVPLAGRAPRIRLQFEILERREQEHAQLQARGKSMGTSVRLASSFDLAESGDGTTLRYEADVTLGGLLGRIPDSTLEPAARRAVDALLRSVERRV